MPEKGKTDFRKQGKRNRQRGAIFESRVREDLIKMGWTIDKWTNTVNFEKEGKIGMIVPSKKMVNIKGKFMISVPSAGFPYSSSNSSAEAVLMLI